MPIHGWPLWKAVGAAFVLYLPLAAILVLIPPPFSLSALLLAGAQIGAGTAGLNWGRWGSPHGSEIIGSVVLTSQFLAIGLRAWSAAGPVPLLSGLVVVVLFLLAWALPLMMPDLSAWLWREQVAPQTKAGRRVLALSACILPTIGVVSASVGMLLSRTGRSSIGWIVVALLAIIVALAWSQATAHQLLSRRGEGR